MGDRRNTKSQSNSQPYGPYMRKVGRRIGTSLFCGLCATLGVNDAGQAETAQSSLAYIYPRDVGHIDQNLRAGETGRVKYVSRGDSFVMQDGLKVTRFFDIGKNGLGSECERSEHTAILRR